MPTVLLHEPKPLYETRRLLRVLLERVAGTEAVELRSSTLLPIAARLARRGEERLVVQAFGRRALAVAVLAARADVLFSPTRFPRAADVAWLRAALRYRKIRVVCASDTERRAWVTGGVPIERCRLVRPGVSLSLPADARTRARERLGFSVAHRVVFCPLPPAGAARVSAVWTGSLLNVLDPNVKLLGWAERGVESLRTLQGRLIGTDVLRILEDTDPDAGFAAADVVLLPPDEAVPPTLIAMAMASGRPVVGRATPAVCETIEDRHTALLTGGRTPKILAERVSDAFNDAALSRKVADRARAEAYEHFLLSRMIADYRTLYAGRAALVPTSR